MVFESYIFYVVLFLVLPLFLFLRTPSLLSSHYTKSSTLFIEIQIILLFIFLPTVIPFLGQKIYSYSYTSNSNSFATWVPSSEFHKVSIHFIRFMIMNIGANYYILALIGETESNPSEIITGIFIVAFLVMTLKKLSFPIGDQVADENTILYQNGLNYVLKLVHSIYPGMKIKVIDSENAFAYYKFISRNTIFISKGMLRLSEKDLERIIFHELAHKEQGLKVIGASIFLLFYFLFIGELFKNFEFLLPTSIVYFIVLYILYFLVLPVPFFVARYLNWSMEVEAEFRAAIRMGKEEYYRNIGHIINNLRKLRLKGESVYGMGIERFYMFYPPPYIQIHESVKQLSSIR